MQYGGLGLIAVALLQSGCVVSEIHEEIIGVNANLDETQAMLNGIREDLDRTHDRLDRVKAQLDTLESIDGSLKDLDQHLASLRSTLKNIDSTIPFLSLTSDDDDEGEAAEGDAASDAPDDE